MRSILILFFILFFQFALFFNANAQSEGNGSGQIGFSFGYAQTAYNMKGYSPKSYFPLGARFSIGSNGIQIGPDFWTSLSGPDFTINDSTGQQLRTEKFKDTYLGGMIRAHAGDDPHDFAVIFRAGMGVLFSKKTIDYSDYYLGLNPNPAIPEGVYKFKNSIGYTGALGVSIPIGSVKIHKVGSNYGNLHLTIEGVFNYNPRKYDNTVNYHTSWGIQAGLSYIIFYYIGR